MTQYIDKSAVENILRELWIEDRNVNPEHRVCYNKALREVQDKLDTLEVKEVENPNDAFIEKAIGWIDYNNREGGCNFDGWEKDFKKHMEGE